MTTTSAPRRRSSARTAAPRLTFAHVLRSEWIKLTGLRTTWICLGAVLVTVVGFGAVAAAVSTGAVATPQGGPAAVSQDPVSTVLGGAAIAVLVIGVLGALSGAREFASGMIGSSFAAVPRRLPVLWAKTVAFVALAVPASTVGVLGAFALGMRILSASGAGTVSWSDPGVARTLVGQIAYLVGVGLLGLLLGVLVRSVAGSLGVLIGGVLVLPQIAGLLLPDGWDAVLKYLPSNAGQSFTSLSADAARLSAGPGALVFVGWIVLAGTAAAVAINRRDA